MAFHCSLARGTLTPQKRAAGISKSIRWKKILRERRFDLYFTGLRRAESRRRYFSATKYGAYFHSKRYKVWKCHPIQQWAEADVWHYHKLYGLPRNPLYDKPGVEGFEVHTACWSCTIPIKHGKIEFLRKNYPKLWKHLLKAGLAKVIIQKKTNGQAQSELTDVYIAQVIDSHPCFFDRI